MRYYETLYIVDPNLENNLLEKTMSEIGKELEKTKSKIINHRLWGKKRLAYQILNQKYGSYIILQFETNDLSKMKEFDTWMKLNNSVLRHMTTFLDKKPNIYEEKERDTEEPEKNNDESSDKITKEQKENSETPISSSSTENKIISQEKESKKEEVA